MGELLSVQKKRLRGLLTPCSKQSRSRDNCVLHLWNYIPHTLNMCCQTGMRTLQNMATVMEVMVLPVLLQSWREKDQTHQSQRATLHQVPGKLYRISWRRRRAKVRTVHSACVALCPEPAKKRKEVVAKVARCSASYWRVDTCCGFDMFQISTWKASPCPLCVGSCCVEVGAPWIFYQRILNWDFKVPRGETTWNNMKQHFDTYRDSSKQRNHGSEASESLGHRQRYSRHSLNCSLHELGATLAALVDFLWFSMMVLRLISSPEDREATQAGVRKGSKIQGC